VNRRLVSVRRFFRWLKESGRISSSPVDGVKELRRQDLAPKTMERSQVRKLLREAEARADVRATAIFSFFLHTGCRVSELVGLELADLVLSDRSGWATFRLAKGNKQRTVPVPLVARRSLQAYLEARPPVATSKVFVGERGALTERGVRALCDKYSAIVGIKIHPHLLRHVFGHEFLAANQNDLVALASLMGHESLNTTRRYAARTAAQLQAAAENMEY
jgi:integrase/recombinase XerC